MLQMPPLRTKDHHARIELDRDTLIYVPGQLCRGHVLVPATSNVENDIISISFIGRIDIKVSSANGQLESQFTDTRTLIEISEVLQNRRYVHSTGELAYNFHLVIPGRRDDTLMMVQEGNECEAPIISQIPDLPSSTQFSHAVVGRGWRAAVEYFFEAKVISPGGSVKTAVSPVRVQAGSCHFPQDLHDPGLRVGTEHVVSIQSWKILPEFQHSPTTFRQRTASLFGSSSIPKFTFEIDVSYPEFLQVGNLQRIPFVLGARPVTELDKTTIVPSATTFYRYPSITIESVAVALHSKTIIQYRTLTKTVSISKLAKIPILGRRHLSHRLVVRSIASDQAVEESNSSIDIGELFNMHLPTPTLSSLGGSRGLPDATDMATVLSPSLDLEALTHEHAISWSISMTCSGERRTVCSGTPQPIRLIEGPLCPAPSIIESAFTEPAPAYRDIALDTVHQTIAKSKAAAEVALSELPVYQEFPEAQLALSTSRQSFTLA